MCLSPLKKKNTYYGSTNFAHQLRHDTEHLNLNLPCGHCAECIAVKQSSWIQRVTEEEKYNHIFFATLTYDNKHLPALTIEKSVVDGQMIDQPSQELQIDTSDLFDEDLRPREGALEILRTLGHIRQDSDPDVSDLAAPIERPAPGTIINGPGHAPKFEKTNPFASQISTYDQAPTSDKTKIVIRYADIHHLQLMFKRMRDNNTLGRPFRYIAVSERGKQGARPHFHILFLVPRRPGDDSCTTQNLNAALKDMLLEFWSTNVGTRKHPKYERNFTYRSRWIGRRLYRNFDCHYVQPNLTKDGVANVAYYVTKYIFKESPREEELRKLLFANLVHEDDEGNRDCTEFKLIWDIVKSRLMCSKGLGLDAECYTVEHDELQPLSFSEYSEAYRTRDMSLCLSEDLPGEDYELTAVPRFRVVTKKRRILVPNFDLIQHLKDNALLEKARGVAIYVKYNGEHVTLSQYYSKRILDEKQLTDLYYSWDPSRYPDKHEKRVSEEEYDRKCRRLAKSRALMDRHGDIDGHLEEVAELGQDIDPYSSYRSVAKLVTPTSQRIML